MRVVTRDDRPREISDEWDATARPQEAKSWGGGQDSYAAFLADVPMPEA
jgi:hypothetical protein